VIVAASPGFTFPMSVLVDLGADLHRVEVRHAGNSTVPPPTSVVGDEITVPNSTFFAMIVPRAARECACRSCVTAFSRSVRARTTAALALA